MNTTILASPYIPTRTLSMESNISELTQFSADEEQTSQSMAAGTVPAVFGENLKGEILLSLAETRSNAQLVAQFPQSDGTPLTIKVVRHRVHYALGSRAKKTGRDYESVKVEHNQIRIGNGVPYLRAGRSNKGGNRYRASSEAAVAPATDRDGDVDMDDDDVSDDDYSRTAGRVIPKNSDDDDNESIINEEGEAIEAANALMSMIDAVTDTDDDDDGTEVTDQENESTVVVLDQRTIDAANSLLGLVKEVRM